MCGECLAKEEILLVNVQRYVFVSRECCESPQVLPMKHEPHSLQENGLIVVGLDDCDTHAGMSDVYQHPSAGLVVFVLVC